MKKADLPLLSFSALALTGLFYALLMAAGAPRAVCGLYAASLALSSLSRLPGAAASLKNGRSGSPALTFCTRDELLKKVRKGREKNCLWLGRGFAWEQRHTERLVSLYKENGRFKGRGALPMGEGAIHAAGKEAGLWVPEAFLEGHTLIIGTTGAGKTRLFDLLISQRIASGETVFIFDPKGDASLEGNAKACCAECGRAGDFYAFHASRPAASFHINPLADFTRVSEIASRIAALMPGTSPNDPFRAFSWEALFKASRAMVYCGKAPSLKRLRDTLDGGLCGLAIETVAACAGKYGAEPPGGEAGPSGARRAAQFYREAVKPVHGSVPEVEGALSLFEHDAAHFSKMTAGLMPFLSMLASGALGEALSPGAGKADEPVLTTSSLIDKNAVAYIGLDSLSDALVGASLGSLLLADLTSAAGARYASGALPEKAVHIFVDEAAEAANDPLIQLLNKGRGAKFRAYLATQTISDFSARLGKDKALQLLGNLNNTIALRTIDPATQLFLEKKLASTVTRSLTATQGTASEAETLFGARASSSERLSEETSPLVPAYAFGQLPNLEFFASLAGGALFKGRVPILKEKEPP